MPISPPPEATLDHPPMGLMDLLGRMRSLTDQAGFTGTLPAIWQCSDESQMIKKALFGYVYDCPSVDLGRVGALLDPTRLLPAGHHGHDIVILGGSHIGTHEEDGIGYVSRIHGKVSTCCGMLCRLLQEYRQVYRRAAQLLKEGEVEDGHLPGVPVAQPVESQDLVELAIAPRVPTAVGCAVQGGREQRGEQALALDELEEVGVPGTVVVVLLDALQPARLEPGDRLVHDVARPIIRVEAVVVMGIEQKH